MARQSIGYKGGRGHGRKIGVNMEKPFSALTPSEKKNRQLFENAGAGFRPRAGVTRWTGIPCRACAHWPLCRQELGEGHALATYCARLSRGFLLKAL